MSILLDREDWEKEHKRLLETNDALLKEFEKHWKRAGMLQVRFAPTLWQWMII